MQSFWQRFGPFFAVQFIGAFTDNLYRNALLIHVTFALAGSGGNATPYVAAAGGVFILPFFLFSALAGQIADKWDPAKLIRILKLWEIVLAGLAGAALILGQPALMLAALFLLGTQAALFGPVKYSVLPRLLDDAELLRGNALVEGATFIAILLGSVGGGLLVIAPNGPILVAGAMIGLSLIAYIAAWLVPSMSAGDAGLKINFNPLPEAAGSFRSARHAELLPTMFGIGWLWFLGSVFLTLFPGFAKTSLHAEAQIATLFMAVFSIGIAIGAALCGKVLRRIPVAHLVPRMAAWMAAFAAILAYLTVELPTPSVPYTVSTFLDQPIGWKILIDLLAMSICAGLYSVPLYARVQRQSPDAGRGRVIAANNIVNAGLMVLASIYIGVLTKFGLSAPGIFIVTGAIGLLPAWLFRSRTA
jgi:MFS family permease